MHTLRIRSEINKIEKIERITKPTVDYVKKLIMLTNLIISKIKTKKRRHKLPITRIKNRISLKFLRT